MLSTSTSTSTYVPSGLSTSTSTSTEIRYSSTMSTSTKYSGPNPEGMISHRIEQYNWDIITSWHVQTFFTLQEVCGENPPVIHNNDVIVGSMASQITCLTLFTQPFIRAQIKENIMAPRHWPLCGEFPAQMASNTENVFDDVIMQWISVWWADCIISKANAFELLHYWTAA